MHIDPNKRPFAVLFDSDDYQVVTACLMEKIVANRKHGMSDHDESTPTASGNLFKLMWRIEKTAAQRVGRHNAP